MSDYYAKYVLNSYIWIRACNMYDMNDYHANYVLR